jgi:hypothetical protein
MRELKALYNHAGDVYKLTSGFLLSIHKDFFVC